MTAHIEKLRAEYPDLPGGYFDLMEDVHRLTGLLDAARTELAHMSGYYQSAGAVPIEKINALLALINPYAAAGIPEPSSGFPTYKGD